MNFFRKTFNTGINLNFLRLIALACHVLGFLPHCYVTWGVVQRTKSCSRYLDTRYQLHSLKTPKELDKISTLFPQKTLWESSHGELSESSTLEFFPLLGSI